MITGYLHADYASSLTEYGTPHLLTQSGAWIIKRQIPDSDKFDAMGCYPLFACQDWSRLNQDLDHIGDNLICLFVVTDPFGEYKPADLTRCFPDVARPFKEHLVVDLGRPREQFVHAHHRRNARKALREMRVEECDNPIDFLDDWIRLYDNLVDRYEVSGIAAFSRASFEKQMRVPGLVALRAVHADATVGMLLWYAQGNRAYYHLGAFHQLGYELGASFALFNYSLDYFRRHGFEWLDLGAGAGTETGAVSGLTRFKQGWSTGVRTAYFCGRIFDRQKYDEVALAKKVPQTNYFPAYRVGEFR